MKKYRLFYLLKIYLFPSLLTVLTISSTDVIASPEGVDGKKISALGLGVPVNQHAPEVKLKRVGPDSQRNTDSAAPRKRARRQLDFKWVAPAAHRPVIPSLHLVKLATLEGHTHNVTAVATSNTSNTSNRIIVSGDSGGYLKAWKGQQKEPFQCFDLFHDPKTKAHKGPVTCVAVSNDGKYIMSGGGTPDASIEFWEWDNDKNNYIHSGTRFDISSSKYHPLSVSTRTRVLHWEDATGDITVDIIPSVEIKRCVCLHKIAASQQGNRFATASQGGVKIWDENKGFWYDSLQLSDICSYSIAPLVNGEFVSGHMDGTVNIWNDGKSIAKMEHDSEEHPVHAVTASPDMKTIFSGGQNTVKIWKQHPEKEDWTHAISLNLQGLPVEEHHSGIREIFWLSNHQFMSIAAYSPATGKKEDTFLNIWRCGDNNNDWQCSHPIPSGDCAAALSSREFVLQPASNSHTLEVWALEETANPDNQTKEVNVKDSAQ